MQRLEQYAVVVGIALAVATSSGRADASPACSGNVTYEAEAITHSIGGATPGGWNLWSAGYISTEHDFVGAETSITLTARGTPLGGVWPRATLSVAGVSESKTIGSPNWEPYTFVVHAAPGRREIRVTFDNDDRSTTEDRNLLIDKLVIGCETVGASSVPTEPIPFTTDDVVELDSGTTNSALIPSSYDSTHQTPTSLLVWLHGCWGTSSGDVWIFRARGEAQHWITLAVGGRDYVPGVNNGCWEPNADVPKVLDAIADLKKHFNIDPKRIILGGYSSGGDLTYRTAFNHARQFAGVIVANSSPFRDTGSTQQASLAAASWHFPIAHLAHAQDGEYPLVVVEREINAVKAHGFADLDFITLDGPHSDPTQVTTLPGISAVSQTNADIITRLLPYMNKGWRAPEEISPADPKLIPAGQAVLTDLRIAPSRSERKLVIGQALRGHDYSNGGVEEPITALTGKNLPAPKLIELDLKEFGVTGAHDDLLYELLADHAAQGGLISLIHHAPKPFSGGVHLAELADPANPQTAAAMAWQGTLDHDAGVLRKLQEAGIPVLYRPLHESNGDWFWWGKAAVSDFRAMWRGVFKYLTVTKSLHNLLWVYSANHNEGGSMDPTAYYPGDDVVDIVGLDIYSDTLQAADPGKPGYAEMVALNKPFAVTEYGPDNADSMADGATRLPNDEVIQVIKAQYPQTVLATAWYSSCLSSGSAMCSKNNWQISDKPFPEALLLDPWAITR
jgi:pimeloyl-ACP methyl ester carboxylesterase